MKQCYNKTHTKKSEKKKKARRARYVKYVSYELSLKKKTGDITDCCVIRKDRTGTRQKESRGEKEGVKKKSEKERSLHL